MFYVEERFNPLSIRTLIIAFIFGATMSIFMAEKAEPFLSNILDNFIEGKSYKIFENYLIIAPVEELSKLLIVLFFFYRGNVIGNPVNVLMLSVVVAMGFATRENVHYFKTYTDDIFLVRSLYCTSGHAIDSAFWGIGLGIAKILRNAKKRIRVIIVGFIFSIISHATWNAADDIGGVIGRSLTLIFFGIMFFKFHKYVIGFQLYSPYLFGTKKLLKIIKEKLPKKFLITRLNLPKSKIKSYLELTALIQRKLCVYKMYNNLTINKKEEFQSIIRNSKVKNIELEKFWEQQNVNYNAIADNAIQIMKNILNSGSEKKLNKFQKHIIRHRFARWIYLKFST